MISYYNRIIKESQEAGCGMVNLLFVRTTIKDESRDNETINGLDELGIEAWDGMDKGLEGKHSKMRIMHE